MIRNWLLFSLCAAAPAQTNPFLNDSKAAEAGRGMFRIYCAPCHGIRAEGGRGPDLTRGVYAAGDKDADLFRIISNGGAGTEMPAYSANLGDENIWRLVSYVRSAARRDGGVIAGNKDSGEKLFWGKGGCSGCHRINTRGGRMGPDLSKAGRTRSLKYLRESVVAPNADLTPGYNTVSVVTRDGKKITGVQRGFDNFSVQLMDQKEQYYSFFKNDVTSATREFKSVMPDTYAKLFSASEVDDLVAYMASLGSTEVSK
ncbi:MAG: c-type cytochrome [Bryobacteraceae bacterium]